MAIRCTAEALLTDDELDQIRKAFEDIDEIDTETVRSNGSRCEYTTTDGHQQHVSWLESGGTDVKPDDNPPSLWMVWDDAGRREIRWQICCPARLAPPNDHEFCVLPDQHPGDCNADDFDRSPASVASA